MLSVQGTFQNGVATPEEEVPDQEGKPVIITFLDRPTNVSEPVEQLNSWKQLEDLIDAAGVRTGVSDLARQHDHYLHGQPKQP